MVAHAAGKGLYPENTIPAINSSFDIGSDWVEIDIRRTSDGVPVLMHDATVDRTTDGTGLISALSLVQVQALDAGSWFAPEYAGTPVPTLEQALQEALGRGPALLDMKDPLIGAVVATALANVGASPSDIRFWASTSAEVTEANTHVPGAPVFYQMLSGDETSVQNILAFGVDGISIRWEILSPTMIQTGHSGGVPVFVWGTTNVQNMATALAWGVDGIHASFPDRPIDLISTPDCMDGADNDLDGLTDHPADPDCTAPEDTSEAVKVPALGTIATAISASLLLALAALRLSRRPAV